MAKVIDRIKSNEISLEDIQAARAFYFFLSLPRSVTYSFSEYRYIIKNSYYGTHTLKNDLYELIPYKHTQLGLEYGSEIKNFLDNLVREQFFVLRKIFSKLGIEFDEAWFCEEAQIVHSEFGLEWRQDCKKITHLIKNLEEVAEFFAENDALTFSESILPFWPMLNSQSKYIASAAIINTFNYTQKMADAQIIAHNQVLTDWVEKIKNCTHTPSYCKPFATHQIDRMLILKNYLEYLVAKIN